MAGNYDVPNRGQVIGKHFHIRLKNSQNHHPRLTFLLSVHVIETKAYINSTT